MCLINRGVVPPVLLQKDVRELIVQLPQTSGVWLIGYVLKPREGIVEVIEEDGELEAKEGIDLFGAPAQMHREPWFGGLVY